MKNDSVVSTSKSKLLPRILMVVLIWVLSPYASADLAKGLKALEDGEYANARKLLATSSGAENGRGEYILGTLYYIGLGGKSDEKAAFDWYQRSAKGGNRDAIYIVANTYMNGHFGDAVTVKKSKSIAAELFRKSAALGHPIAAISTHELALQYHKFPATLSCAERGITECQSRAYIAYEVGSGVEENPERALHWLNQVAEKGNPFGQLNLGAKYLEGAGVQQDLYRGLFWSLNGIANSPHPSQEILPVLRRAFGQNDALLIRCAESGQVMCQFGASQALKSSSETSEQEQAARFLQEAAEAGYSPAQYILSIQYRVGTRIERSNVLGRQWLLRAAESGSVEAAKSLGESYLYGRDFEKDRSKALWWTLIALEQDVPGAESTMQDILIHPKVLSSPIAKGDSHSEYLLGLIFDKGIFFDLPQQSELADFWYKKAAQHGNARAMQRLKIINNQIVYENSLSKKDATSISPILNELITQPINR